MNDLRWLLAAHSDAIPNAQEDYIHDRITVDELEQRVTDALISASLRPGGHPTTEPHRTAGVAVCEKNWLS